jgi:hypothetical protein
MILCLMHSPSHNVLIAALRERIGCAFARACDICLAARCRVVVTAGGAVLAVSRSGVV